MLPICQDLNVPMVLDWHHHKIQHAEGELDIRPLLPAIRETWTRRGITQKMHYSEPCDGANTVRDLRKHSPRVRTLPPCADDMDLMIEAKDKEQAVLELYRKYNIEGGKAGFKQVVQHVRDDDMGGDERKSHGAA